MRSHEEMQNTNPNFKRRPSKREKSKYSLTLFHTQNGIKTATRLLQENTDFSDNNVTLDKTNLYYNQRSISNILLSSKHQFNKKLEFSGQSEPHLYMWFYKLKY